MAVVVQQLVPADAAGILFTVDPVSGNSEHVIINAVWGLGEAVVGGRVTPDIVVAEKSTGRVHRVDIGEQEEIMIPAEVGTTAAPVDPERRGQPVLSETRVGELVRLGRDIETLFDAPQDVEWTIASGLVFILQARPVTALAPGRLDQRIPSPDQPAPLGDDHWPAPGDRAPLPFDVWTRSFLEEVWPQPVSPLTWSAIPAVQNQAFRTMMGGLGLSYLDDVRLVARFFGRVYGNDGALRRIMCDDLGLPSSMLTGSVGDSPYRARATSFRPLQFLRHVPGIVRLVRRRAGAARRLEALFPTIDTWAAAVGERDLGQLGDRELWAEGERWQARFAPALDLHNTTSTSAMAAFAQLRHLVARWTGRGDLAQDLVSGVHGVFAAEMGTTLWEMAAAARQCGVAAVVLEHEAPAALSQLRARPDARPVLDLLHGFLERHGHRCPHELEWRNPRWVEAPHQVIEVLAGYLRGGDSALGGPRGGDLGDRSGRIGDVRAARRRREAAETWVEGHLDPVRRWIFRRLLRRAQRAVRLRDNGRYYVMKTTLPFRRVYALLGERWAARGWLDRPEDIFFLALSEIEMQVTSDQPPSQDLRSLVAGRREAHDHWQRIEAPDVLGPTGQPFVHSEAVETEGVLRGIAASGGWARGPARILRHPREVARLHPGDILVMRATDPGWTPVFPLVGGLVLEAGGQLSHGAIVAREYGVPAVLGVRGATRLIRDGQMLTVDGTAGQVLIER